MSKLKLVFVINTLQKGGAERVLSTLGNSFSKRDYEVIIICMNEAPDGYPLAESIRVVRLLKKRKKENAFRRVWYGALTYIMLLKVLKEEKADFVISFMTSANLWTGLSCGLLKIPYIVSERITPDLSVNQFNFFFKWLSYHIYKKSEAIVIPAKGIEDCMKKNSLFKNLKNYRLIKNPVNVFKPSASGFVHHRKFILAVGRLSYQKGFDLLIEAFSKIKIQNIDLLIVGAGKEKTKLMNLVYRLGLQNNVFLVGARDNIQDYYDQTELFVLSSRNEGYPNALIEAMSMGCPCIAMDCEFGPSEIIENGINGILIENGNVNALTKAIFNVLFDPAAKRKLGLNARKIAQTNSLEAISDKWEELILKAV